MSLRGLRACMVCSIVQSGTKFVSSGCIRMTNEDVTDLFSRVNIGTKVVVLPKTQRRPIDAYAAMPRHEVSVTVHRQPLARSNVTSGMY